MKKVLAIAVAVGLVGCASNQAGSTWQDLIRPDNLRTERTLNMTFPEIQMMLFKHSDVCGRGPVFKMKEGETSYATITESEDTDNERNRAIVFDLMWLQPTLRYETRTRVSVYSFYRDAEIKQRIDSMFNAITDPEQCS